MEQILFTVDGALQDPTLGLSARIAALKGVDDRIRDDVQFKAWAMAGTMTDTRAPNVMLRPRRWLATSKASDTGHRDADAQLDIGYEYFGGDPQHIQDNVALVATALVQVIDELRAYSDATGGTIIDVTDPVLFEFGQFAGPVSNGFLATLTLTERSDQ